MMLIALLKAIHVLAVMLWVGGMAFAHFFLRPSLSLLEPEQRVRLMHAVLGRFFVAVLWANGLILASGLWIIGRVARQVAGTGGSLIWPLDWVLMVGVGLLMMAIFGHIRFVLYRRMDTAVKASNIPAGAAALADIRRWVAVNMALGVALTAGVLIY